MGGSSNGKQESSNIKMFGKDTGIGALNGMTRSSIQWIRNPVAMRHEDNFEGADDLKQLKILRMMAQTSYIIACYLTTLEASNVIQKDERRYKCSCVSEVNQEDFHYCPASNKFVPSYDCRQHIECNDPIYRCFNISQKCSHLSNRVPEFGEECKEIAEKAIQFSVEILNQCSNTNEVETLLSEQSGLAKLWRGKFLKIDDRRPTLKYPRIYAALWLNHKEFVSHMYCQQTLRQQWHGGVKWQGQSLYYKVSKT